jgi:hypothetical protein
MYLAEFQAVIASAWRKWGKPPKKPVRTVDILAEIQKGHMVNTSEMLLFVLSLDNMNAEDRIILKWK